MRKPLNWLIPSAIVSGLIPRKRRVLLIIIWLIGAVITMSLGIWLDKLWNDWTALTPEKILRQLHNPDTTLVAKLWIEEEGKTTFKQGESVNFYYSVTNTLKGEYFYINLINISTLGSVFPILENQQICAGYAYSLPTLVKVDCPKNSKSIDEKVSFNHTGQEYFKLIIANQPMTWKNIVNDFKNNTLQLKQPWATVELNVTVN